MTWPVSSGINCNATNITFHENQSIYHLCLLEERLIVMVISVEGRMVIFSLYPLLITYCLFKIDFRENEDGRGRGEGGREGAE